MKPLIGKEMIVQVLSLALLVIFTVQTSIFIERNTIIVFLGFNVQIVYCWFISCVNTIFSINCLYSALIVLSSALNTIFKSKNSFICTIILG